MFVHSVQNKVALCKILVVRYIDVAEIAINKLRKWLVRFAIDEM